MREKENRTEYETKVKEKGDNSYPWPLSHVRARKGDNPVKNRTDTVPHVQVGVNHTCLFCLIEKRGYSQNAAADEYDECDPYHRALQKEIKFYAREKIKHLVIINPSNIFIYPYDKWS